MLNKLTFAIALLLLVSGASNKATATKRHSSEEAAAAAATTKILSYDYEATVVTLADSLAEPTGFKLAAKATLELLYAEANSILVKVSLVEAPKYYQILPNQQQPSLQQQQQQSRRHLLDNDLICQLKFSPTPQQPTATNKQTHNKQHSIFATVLLNPSNKTASIQQIYTHSEDSTTFKNIKKALLFNLLPSNNHLLALSKQATTNDNKQQRQVTDDNLYLQPELFSPNSNSTVELFVEAIDKQQPNQSESNEINNNNNDDDNDSNHLLLFKYVAGTQRLSFGSRIFNQAVSTIATNFELKLTKQSRPVDANNNNNNYASLSQAIKSEILANSNKYSTDVIELRRERKVCSQTHCEYSLKKLYDKYEEDLSDEKLASIEGAIAQVRMLNAVRSSETSVNDITKLLKSATFLKKSRNSLGLQSSYLDILVNARTNVSIAVALKHLKLPKNNDLDTAERFLNTLSVSSKTYAKMRPNRPLLSPYSLHYTKHLPLSKLAMQQRAKIASNEFIARQLFRIVTETPGADWESEKLFWSTILTLTTVVNARNIEQSSQTHPHEPLVSVSNATDSLSIEVSAFVIDELSNCAHDSSAADCRVVMLHALGNLGSLSESTFAVLRSYILSSGRRESIAAMKVLRDLLLNCGNNQQNLLPFFSELKELLIRVVYDKTLETTSRILAAEMIVRFLPDSSLASKQLLLTLPMFNNNELAKMMYMRMSSLKPHDLRTLEQENWYWHSSIINGRSASFIRTMARTESLNASYGVNVELAASGAPKEAAFDLFLEQSNKIQDLFSLGIYARGLSQYFGGNSQEADDDNADVPESESVTVGMAIKFSGGYLRPLVFFNGVGELMSHMWHQTAKNPTTVFKGNLMLIDHDDAYPLISGFVAEQQMRGILSIDVTGKITASYFSKSSHSEVRTEAAVIVHASQSVFTSYDDFWDSHFFSFGGKALVDFVTDCDFYSSPEKICLQVTQPQFKLRYNSRRHKQFHGADTNRRMVRKNHFIEAKSYPLNAENNKMCAAMLD